MNQARRECWRLACACWCATASLPRHYVGRERAALQLCLLDGEAVICGEDGIPIFSRLWEGKQVKGQSLLFAFDLIELDGRDLRREPSRHARPRWPSSYARRRSASSRTHHRARRRDLSAACRMGLEGIVSKRKGSAYRSGRSPDWLKMKNPQARP
jgi:bifunctional non-homologous end joining protein LigD